MRGVPLFCLFFMQLQRMHGHGSPFYDFLAFFFSVLLVPAAGVRDRTTSATPLVLALVNTLALASLVPRGRAPAVQALWAFLQRQHDRHGAGGGAGGAGAGAAIAGILGLGSGGSGGDGALPASGDDFGGGGSGPGCVAAALCVLLSQLLVVVDDAEVPDPQLHHALVDARERWRFSSFSPRSQARPIAFDR